MKHIQSFEKKFLKNLKSLKNLKVTKNMSFEDKENLLDDCAYYLENNVPITGTEGFIECLHDASNYIYSTEYNRYPIYMCFYFNINIEDDKLDLFYKFLNEYELTNNKNEQTEIFQK